MNQLLPHVGVEKPLFKLIYRLMTAVSHRFMPGPGPPDQPDVAALAALVALAAGPPALAGVRGR